MSIVVAPDSLHELAGNRVESRAKDCKKTWKVKRTYTTGERRFAECRQFCRVPKIGHSAKPLFAECRTGWHSAKSSTRQRVALPSATECPALGKGRHSAKALFAECNTRQRVALGKKMALDGRARPRRQIFLKKFFAKCRPWHSAKRAFAKCQGPALGKDPFFAECQGRHSAKYISFLVFFAPLFFCSLNILFKTPCSNLAEFWLFLLYFVSFFCFVEFYGIFQIWTAGAWNNWIWSFKKWYSWYLVYAEAVSRNSHEISSILLT